MGGKIEKKGPLPMSNEPGPGHYNATGSLKEGSIKIGKENRPDMARKGAKNEPGPGAYNKADDGLSSSYFFPKDTRKGFGGSKNNNPGPGYYKIPSTVG